MIGKPEQLLGYSNPFGSQVIPHCDTTVFFEKTGQIILGDEEGI